MDSFNAPPAPGKTSGCASGIVKLFVIFVVVCLLFAAGLITLLVFIGVSSSGEIVTESGKSFTEEFVSGNRWSGDKIALIDISGVIMPSDRMGMFGKAVNAEDICDQLGHAADDDAVKAIIIRLETPGGEITASDNIHHAIEDLRKTSGKPVVAVMGSLAASGGYYAAVACDHIIAHRMTTTGSIGVIWQSLRYYELFQKIGLKSDTCASGPMKGMFDGGKPGTPAEREVVQTLIDEAYSDFVRVVADGRPELTAADIVDSEIGDGRIFSGIQALDLKLIDQLGYFKDAVDEAASRAGMDSYKIVRYRHPFDFSAIFGASAKTGDAASLRLELPGTERSTCLAPGRFYYLPSVGW